MTLRQGVAQTEIEVSVEFEKYSATHDDPGDIVMKKITVCEICDKEYTFTEDQISALPPPFDEMIEKLVSKAIEDSEEKGDEDESR